MTIQQHLPIPLRTLAALLVASCFGAAQAAPATPQVVSGQATFAQNGNVFSITNTPNTVINWQSFSINAGEVTRFIQQSSDSAVLNRIVGQNPSQILGALQSNGRVFLINPNGILFGRESRVDVNGLTASTLALSDADFLSGNKRFGGGAKAGAIVNQGRISTPSGGQVFLIASQVDNQGIITSPQGQVLLAAGHSVQLVDSANPSLHVVVSAPADHAVNLGQVIAQGGKVGIYGALVSQRGVVNANSARLNEQGKVVLRASGDAMLEAGSVTTATGLGRGGDVSVEGARVGMVGNARIDASGARGGTVLLGGGYQGKNALMKNAQHTLFGKNASVKADGGGGTVVLWSDGNTRALGQVSARGGLVETSGKYLDVNGIGVQAGTWLLDPWDIEIVATGGASNLNDADQFQDAPSFSSINAGTLTSVAPGTHIVLQAMHDVKFSAAINPALGSGSLTVDAGNSIFVNAAIGTGGGGLWLNANHPDFASKTGSIVIGPGGSIDTGGGNVMLNAFNVMLGGPLTTRDGNLSIHGGAQVRFDQNISTGNGHLIASANDIGFGGVGTTATGGFMSFNSMGGPFTLGPAWTLATANAIDIHADTMSLFGTIGPSQTARPMLNLSTHTPGRTIDIGSGANGPTGPTGNLSLVLDPAALTRFDVDSINIGNFGGSGNINVLSDYSGGNAIRLALHTQGNITVDAPILMPTDVNSALLLMVNGTDHKGSITTGANGQLAASHIELRANNMSLGASIAGTGEVALMPHMGTGQIVLGAGALDGFDTLGLLDTELTLIRTHRLRIGAYDGQMGGLTLTAGGMDFSTILPPESELALMGGLGNVTLNGKLVTPGFLFMEGNHLQTATGASAKAQAIRMQSHSGIGGNATPFVTQTGLLSASNDSPEGLAPINIVNTGELFVHSIHQVGAGNQGAIVIANNGGMTVAGGEIAPPGTTMPPGTTEPPGTTTPGETTDPRVESSIVAGGSGSITLKTMSPLTILGNVTTENGAIILEAGNGGLMTIGTAGHVSSAAGNIVLTAGALVNAGKVGTGTGDIIIKAPSVTGAGIFSAPGGTIIGLPVKVPTVTECLGNATIAGCTAVLKAALDACVAAPGGANCLALLPSLAVCTVAPTTYGCQVVLPTLAQCIDSPTLQGCTAVLPTLSECASAPTAPGCSVVLLPVTPVADSKLEEAIKVTVDALAQSHEDVVLGAGDEEEKKDDSVTAVVATVQGEKPNEIPKTYCN